MAEIKMCYDLKKALHQMHKIYTAEPWEPVVDAMTNEAVTRLYLLRLKTMVQLGERRVHDLDSRRKHKENQEKLHEPPPIEKQRQAVVRGGRQGYAADLPRVSSPRTC